MARLQIRGLDEYAEKIKRLSNDTPIILKEAVFNGAAIVADTIKDNLKNIPIQEGENGLPPYAEKGEKLTGLSRKQKEDLLDNFGLAPIENRNGYVQTKAGFDGYGSIKTKKYPNGVPNTMLMRSIESGTSFREKHPVIRPAVNMSKKAAVEKMNQTMEESLRKEFG